MRAKSVLITGGSRGIGAAVAILAAQKGWDVVITYQKAKAEADNIVSQIKEIGQRGLAIQVDIGEESQIVDLFTKIDTEFGELDALVNNAGVIAPISSFVDIDAQRIRDVFNINVVGSFICAREAVKRMSCRRAGAIVNVSSAASRLGSANEFIDYAASKGAIDTFTLGLSKEVAALGIRVNAVRPGLINTQMHRDAGDEDRPQRLQAQVAMQRPGEPLEIANAILWLVADEASYVTGALLDVTGGR
jgi:NAD(P)-dependent dehydrogenase (short-subunit alcohol dehydrogenase family)